MDMFYKIYVNAMFVASVVGIIGTAISIIF